MREGSTLDTVWRRARMIVVILIAAPLLAAVFGYRTAVVQSGSMEPGIERGDLLIIREVSASDLEIGQVVTYRSPVDEDVLITHRIERVRPVGQRIEFVTRGDANVEGETWRVARDGTVGRLVASLPGAGAVVGAIAHPIVPMVLLWLAVALLAKSFLHARVSVRSA